MNGLTDQEFRHYQELYNPDPIVQRLCRCDPEELVELDAEITELRSQLDELEWDLHDLKEHNRELTRENKVLRNKLQMWDILQNKDLE